MRHSTSLETLHVEGAWVSIGTFDGVHCGHQHLIHHLVEGSRAVGAPSAVITFYPHPVTVLQRLTEPLILTNPQERAVLLGRLGVDEVITLTFTPELAAQSADLFVLELVESLGMKHLVVGPDFVLGRRRAGDLPALQRMGERYGFTVDVVEPIVEYLEVVSSSRIRKAMAEGNLVEANRMLRRMVSIPGVVVHGDGRGKGLGFPPANLALEPDRLLPANGVYAAWAWLDNEVHRAVVNIGLRPTFEYTPTQPRLEAHLLDYSGSLYGRRIRLEFDSRIRPEQRFPSKEALIAQIHQDITTAREVLIHVPQTPDLPA
mgnify:CR=1 FL=1